MSTMITKNGYEQMKEELRRLMTVDRPLASKMMEENRPIGVAEDNPEYMMAVDNQNRVEKRIYDLNEILMDCVVFEKCMCKDNEVSFGTTVEFADCDTDEIKVYTIVSVYESNVNKGLVSVQCPFVRNMMGLHCGDYFEFNDKEYIITKIDYSLVIN